MLKHLNRTEHKDQANEQLNILYFIDLRCIRDISITPIIFAS